MAVDAEQILLHIRFDTIDLQQDQITMALPMLKETLSACLLKGASAKGITDFWTFRTGSSKMLVIVLPPPLFPAIVECLQSWSIHQKTYSLSVMGQRGSRVVESTFPLGFHQLDAWIALYRQHS